MVENLTAETFREKVFDYKNEKEWKYRGELPCIIDFYADWCGPCKMVSPILDELSEEYTGKIKIYKILIKRENFSIFFFIIIFYKMAEEDEIQININGNNNMYY